MRGAGWLVAGLLLVSCGNGGSQPDLLLITIDTLRADRVGAYGHAAAATPVLDRLAREGVRFDQCWSPVPVTLPAHASLLTGRLPGRHGVRNNLTYRLPESTPTLAGALSDAGYHTGAFISAFPLDARFGLDQGFHHYDDDLARGASSRFEYEERPATEVVKSALEWARQQDDGKPLFVWVHFFEPHAPYTPPPAYANRGGDSYDGEVAAADAAVGTLLRSWEALRKQRPVVAVTSDHGEGLGEHGETTHSFFLYESTLRVPLILHGPAIAPAVVSEPVSLCDLTPTLLAAIGETERAQDGRWVDGIVLDPGGTPPRRSLVAETLYGMEAFGWSPMFALRDGSQKVIRSRVPRAYDLKQDPHETNDLHPSSPAWAVRSLTHLDSVVSVLTAMRSQDSARQPTPEETEALAALGYVGGTPQLSPVRDDDAYLRATRELPDGTAQLGEFNRLTRAQELIEANDLDGAIAILEDLVAANPRNGWAHSLLAGSYRESGRTDQALAAFEASLREQPRRVDAHLNLARLKLSLGQEAEAVEHYRNAMELDPDDVDLLQEAARILVRTGRLDEALARTREQLQGSPDPARRPRLDELMARLYLIARRPEEGRDHLARARAAADRPALLLLEGAYLEQAGDWSGLLDLLDESPFDLTRNPDALALRGQAIARLAGEDGAP